MKKTYSKPEVCCKCLESGGIVATSGTYIERSEKIIKKFMDNGEDVISNCPERNNK